MIYFQIAKRLDLKSHHKKKKKNGNYIKITNTTSSNHIAIYVCIKATGCTL